MSKIEFPVRLAPEPLPDNLQSVQPGGGVCYSIELAWGKFRRWCLKSFRPGYVKRMAERRHGSTAGAPHEILDPRDLKYCRNRVLCDWDPADDRFRWRDKLPFARWGLAEILLMSSPLVLLGAVGAWFSPWLILPAAVLLAFVFYFFRDPHRVTPTEPGLLISPADGTIAEISKLEHEPFIGGPAVRIGIFLSVFNVHINRAPSESKVIRLVYQPGLFMNALNPESAIKNENMWIGLEEEVAPHRRLVVRQIAGLLARRIVCNLRSGEVLSRGQQFGMIKLGSRTELILPDEPGLQIVATVGQKVQGGSSVLARFATG
jgi:phosphatidylserine decarboxylase